MRLAAEGFRRIVAVLAGCGLLAGCASAPRPAGPLLPPATQATLLGGLSAFGLDGRVNVVAGGQGDNAGFSWRQTADRSSVRLSAPLGAGSLTVEYAPDSLRVTTSRGEELRDAAAADVIERELGFVPPFASLRYWMLGLAAPGAVATGELFDEAGRVLERHQHGWHILYERWMDHGARAGTLRLPQRITATHESLRLRVFVERWNLD